MDDTGTFRPLEGVRVVEVSHMVFGPACGMFLAFLGAEVIKVEPAGGDKTRHLEGMGASFFPTFNRGKKSIVLDLFSTNGKRAFDALLSTADVLVENFRDSSLEGMGLDPEDLRLRHPKLVTVSCKGFLDGPYRQRAALDEVVQMMTGLAYMTGPVGRPLRIGSSANDIMGGLFGAYTAMAALGERDKTGRGRHVRVGLFENCLLMVAQHMVQYEMLGVEPSPMPDREFSWPVYDIFKTADGADLFIGVVTDRQWINFCNLMGLERFLADPELQTRGNRIKARYRTIPEIQQYVGTWKSSDLSARLESEGIPNAPVARPSQMYSDPQASQVGGVPTSTLPSGREFRAPGIPVEIDGARLTGTWDVPALGDDSEDILGQLGFNREFVENMARNEEDGFAP